MDDDKRSLYNAHPMIDHVAKMKVEYTKIDFRGLKEIDLNYKS